MDINNNNLKRYRKDLEKFPRLTKKEELELFEKIKNGCKLSRQKLIESKLRLVYSEALKYTNSGIPLLDLIQEGNIGMLKAIEKFNFKKGRGLNSYICVCTHGCILHCLRDKKRIIHVPRYIVEKIGVLTKTKNKLLKELKRLPTNEEINKNSSFSIEEIRQLVLFAELHIPIDSFFEGGGEEEGNGIKYSREDINRLSVFPCYSKINENSKSNKIKEAFSRLTALEQKVLDENIGLKNEKKSVAAISSELGISISAVNSIKIKAKEKIKMFFGGELPQTTKKQKEKPFIKRPMLFITNNLSKEEQYILSKKYKLGKICITDKKKKRLLLNIKYGYMKESEIEERALYRLKRALNQMVDL